MKNLLFIPTIYCLTFLSVLLFSCEEDMEDINDQFTLSVDDLNLSIEENPNPNTPIGTFKVTQSDTSEVVTFKLSTLSVDQAVVVDSDGTLIIADTSKFDYESSQTIVGKVIASGGMTADTASFKIDIIDVDESVEDIIEEEEKPFTLSIDDLNLSIQENPETNTPLGTFEVTQSDSSQVITFKLTTLSLKGAVVIDDNGTLIVSDSSKFDYELVQSISGEVVVSGETATDTAAFDISIVDVEETEVEDCGDLSLIAPENQAEISDLKPLLQWSTIVGATQYEVFLGSSLEDMQLLETFSSPTTQYQLVNDLLESTEYFWRVEATDNEGRYCSEVYSFTTTAQQDTSPGSIPFITGWNIPADDLTFEFIVGASALTNTIDWGDGTDPETFDGGFPSSRVSISHTYEQSGIYQISISGSFTAFNLFNFPREDRSKLVDVAQWGNIPWSTMLNAFRDAVNLEGFSATDTPDLSAVTAMNNMFSGAILFNGDISQWDVSNVTIMSSMFVNARNFNQPLNDWDVSNVTTMFSMFMNADAFNQPLNQWQTTNLGNTVSMFANTAAFNQNINSWDVSDVTSTSGMFRQTESFNQPLDQWDMSNVTNTSAMFQGAQAFNQPLNDWNVSKVASMYNMFSNPSNPRVLTVFNQPLDSWNTSAVNDLRQIFFRAESFSQDISGWNTSSATKCGGAWNFSGLSPDQIPATTCLP